MNKNDFLNEEVKLQAIKSMNQFLSIISERFRFPSYFNFNIDGMDECMRDLSWIREKYININFLGLDEIKCENLRRQIEDCIMIWKEYWDNAESYQDYWTLHPYGKTVIITF